MDLINEFFYRFLVEVRMLFREKRRVLVIGDELIKSLYFKRIYSVVGVFLFYLVRINDFFRKEGFGRVMLRISVFESEYWRIRKKIEENLRGERRVFVFKVGEKVVIVEEL